MGGAGWAEGSAFFASAAFVFTGSTFFAGAGSGCWTTGFVAFFGGVSSTSSVGTSSRARPANSSTASSALSSIPNRSASSSKASSRSRSSASSSSSWTEGSDCAVVRCATARSSVSSNSSGRAANLHRMVARGLDQMEGSPPTDVSFPFVRTERSSQQQVQLHISVFQGYLLACESALSLSINIITSRVKQLELSPHAVSRCAARSSGFGRRGDAERCWADEGESWASRAPSTITRAASTPDRTEPIARVPPDRQEPSRPFRHEA